ncbi:MAG: hypothetical protein ACI97B_003331 [Verrucomicrobiales bacterium]
MTLSAWVKPDTVESGADQDMIIANGWDGARTDWWLGLNQINNAEVARFEGGFHQTEGAFAGDFTDGAWHLVTGVIDGPTFTVYIDGAFAQSSSVSLGLDGVSNTAVYIGAIKEGNQKNFDGMIDDVRIYDHALSAGDVAALYAAVPEPSAAWLLIVGCGILSLSRRR